LTAAVETFGKFAEGMKPTGDPPMLEADAAAIINVC
jgi:hypothetical protein